MELATRQKEFAALIQDHRALIFKVCHLYCKTETDREDLFQEIVFQLWKSYESFRGRSAVTTWMYRVALNTAISGFRKNKLGRLTTYVDELPAQLPQDDRGAEQKERLEQLRRAIAQLSDVEKSIVMLYLDDRSYDEMEAILGIKVVNLRVKMNRIKEKLRRLTWN
ncbi:MAG TPA: sigma-70 family RNA polymerase sigma factor [Dinghuibacter sp.]|uniref:RNA polymerase sigma factor n=1 Tax=Dinghuibacter sp. TaxID=2024697 RepID=UPI002C3DC028|nr:sigma-70 family RNA polymerase sigma factor [Dinghuibacter sp.]HTJ11164.1 sigma-70 family RNA polymerase sigma factor [Dinghuibacter sp.]